jgi:hypothetical protein
VLLQPLDGERHRRAVRPLDVDAVAVEQPVDAGAERLPVGRALGSGSCWPHRSPELGG